MTAGKVLGRGLVGVGATAFLGSVLFSALILMTGGGPVVLLPSIALAFFGGPLLVLTGWRLERGAVWAEVGAGCLAAVLFWLPVLSGWWPSRTTQGVHQPDRLTRDELIWRTTYKPTVGMALLVLGCVVGVLAWMASREPRSPVSANYGVWPPDDDS